MFYSFFCNGLPSLSCMPIVYNFIMIILLYNIGVTEFILWEDHKGVIVYYVKLYLYDIICNLWK